EREANDHRHDERDRHLHDGPAQVFEMLEKRLGRFALRQLAKFENVSQRHWIESQRRSSERKPRAASRAQMPRVLASRISFSAIMRRISGMLNARQSRIDSDSSRTYIGHRATGRAKKK